MGARCHGGIIVAAPVLTPAAHGGACGDAWNALIHDPERIARATPAEVLPLFQGMMKGGCKACPSAQTRVCQNLEKPLSYLGRDIVAPWMTMPWEFKAHDVLAGGVTDNSVRFEDVQRVMAACEANATDRGHDAVSLADLVETLVALTATFEYAAPDTVEPAFDGLADGMGSPVEVIRRGRREHDARAAAFRSDPAAMRRNAEAVIESLPHEARIHDELANRDFTWCNHVPHLFTRLLTRISLSDSELDALLANCERVADERAHPGVTPRDVDTALMRLAIAGLYAD